MASWLLVLLIVFIVIINDKEKFIDVVLYRDISEVRKFIEESDVNAFCLVWVCRGHNTMQNTSKYNTTHYLVITHYFYLVYFLGNY